jgi:sigma-B regulation protein RsbU (phosphoserine phosphatase)
LSELERTEDLEDLYENAPCGYLSIGADGRIAKVNRTLCKWLDKSSDEIVGKRLRELLNIAGSIFYETHLAPLLRMQGFFNEVALDLVTGNSTTMATIANAAERRDEDGNVIFTRLTIFKSTERRRYERELVDARDSLVADVAEYAAERMANTETAALREQFIAVLGHDLRNPLAAIDAGRRMLEKAHQDPKSVRITRLMGDSVSRMGGLIDNVMDFARGRLGGGIGIEIKSGDRIEPTLAQVVNEIKTGHPHRQIDMNLDLSQAVDVDHARIAQMFSNLLGNAITHGSEDHAIVVEASIVDGHFELAIANGGDPIPSLAMDRLFQPFYRGDVKPTAQGLGLGLYIASQIAQAHGGRLEVRSDEQETRFTFRMPV